MMQSKTVVFLPFDVVVAMGSSFVTATDSVNVAIEVNAVERRPRMDHRLNLFDGPSAQIDALHLRINQVMRL